jgi:hypothetical protein
MIVGSSQLWKKTLLCRIFETDAQFLLALFNLVFVPYIRFITVKKQQKSEVFVQIANTFGFRTKQNL